MKPLLRILLISFLFAAGVGAAQADSRHRHHGHSHNSFGFYIGGPIIAPSPFYYPPPYYYPPRVIVVPPPPPPVYIEQSQTYDSDQYWYFCQQSGAYYPHVNQCPGGWIRVPPRQ